MSICKTCGRWSDTPNHIGGCPSKTTPTNPPAKHPPRAWISAEHLAQEGHAVATLTGVVGNERYLSKQEHTALLQEERRRAFEEAAEMCERERDNCSAFAGDLKGDDNPLLASYEGGADTATDLARDMREKAQAARTAEAGEGK